MSYIGNPIVSTDFPVDYKSGNGSTTAFTLSIAPASVNSIDVQISGVSQSPQTYSVSGTTLTFSAAPPTGTNNIVVRHLGIAGIPNVPTTASVTSASLAAQDLAINGVTVGKGGGSISTNTVVGSGALPGNTTGIGYNSIFGIGSGLNISSGTLNTFAGSYAGSYATTGSNNVAFGSNAYAANGTSATGSFNTAIGNGSLQNNTTASNNTAVGYQAGYSNTTGTYNTFLGYAAGYTSNRTSDVNGYSTCVGAQAGYSMTTAQFNTFIGDEAGYAITTGSKNTILGRYNGNQGGLDIRTSGNNIVISDGDGTPSFYYTSSASAWYLPATYNVATASAANMVIFSGGLMARSTSALKYKTDIRDLPSIDVNKFRPVIYKSKGELDDKTKDHFGIIADEVNEAGIKELVTYGIDGEVEGFQYERLTVVLLKAIQELNADLASTKLMLTEVSNKVEVQALEIKALKGTV